MKSFLIQRLKSFRCAINGLFSLFKTEPNACIHLAATLFALLLSFLLRISTSEWLWIILSIGLVWSAELFNTSIEKLADLIEPNIHPQIRLVKDLAASGVLVTAIFSIIVAAIIFLPYLFF